MTRSQVLDRPLNRTTVADRPVVAPRGRDRANAPVRARRGGDVLPRGAVPAPVQGPAQESDALGDDAFSRTLYERHGTVLLSFVVQLCGGDRYRAEDVVQETAVRAWQHRGILDPTTDQVRTWLFTVAHRLVIDHHRARQARPKEVADEPEEPAVPDPADRVVTLRAVLETMTELTVQQREVLIYTYYAGYSVEQTAAALGLAPGTVKSRAHYAMRALRASLRAQAVMD
ncbi:sigma-70 family RNA polymerase sigma factor [Actinoallomurus sp. CA-142502]|uniref:sigma-70 family RNA polymerase sigma factor n=1 Tax=Actinoallomurus sp. CA-142502 TaxID=3239885 RepID=UPI003D8B8D03